MIKYFKIFLEKARFSDVVIYNGEDEEVNKYLSETFIPDTTLIEYIKLDDVIFGDKIIKIEWNHKTTHDIIKRIENRTNVKNIKEFNELLYFAINDIFNIHFDDITKKHKKYNIYLKNRNISIITIINYDNLFDINTIIYIKTIINSFIDNDIDTVIEIND